MLQKNQNTSTLVNFSAPPRKGASFEALEKAVKQIVRVTSTGSGRTMIAGGRGVTVSYLTANRSLFSLGLP